MHNKHRGLRISGTNFVYFDEGAYGTIFIDRTSNKVRKIFHRPVQEAHARRTFESEAKAYELAAGNKSVSGLIAGNFRRCPQNVIVDARGADVTSDFYSDMAFETDFVPGGFIKAGQLGGTGLGEIEVNRIRELFRGAGVNYTADISVVRDEKGRIAKVIDFAVEEFELWHDYIVP